MKQVLAPVISNIEVIPGVFLVWLKCPEIATLSRPGQFVMAKCGDAILRRPLSIHQVESTKTNVALLYAVVGEGTRWLSARKRDESVDLFGPLGNGFTISHQARKLLLFAGGLGVAPLYFLAQLACAEGRKVKFLIGGKTAAQVYPQALIPDPVEVIYCTEDASLGRPGRITTFIPDYFDWADQSFGCGPLQMYRNMAENFPQLKGKPVQISLEMRMACGFGVCYGCTVKTKQGLKEVCKDGPIFDLHDILWDELRC